jgi:glycosyltransferase involved in cell wall biosynthesis
MRGHAPAIVAQYLTQNLRLATSYTVCDAELFRPGIEIHPVYGYINRIRQGNVYRRLFTKMTRLDPYPLCQRAAKIVNSVEADIFHSHQLEFPFKKFSQHIRNKRLITLAHIHVFRSFKPELGIADRYVAVSDYAKRTICGKRGFPEELVEVIHNGVDTQLFCPLPPEDKLHLRQALGIPGHAIVISYVGMKVAIKGYLAFLESAKHLLNKYDSVYAVAAGRTPQAALREEDYLRITRLYNELQRHPRFFNFSLLAHNKLKSIYQISDIVSFLTYASDETFGLVAVEAQACGCVLLASNHNALCELVKDRQTGFIVNEPRNIDAIIEQSEYIVEHLPDLDIIRQQARESAIKRFDWRIAAEKLEKLYFELYRQKSRCSEI